jgi:hypothetical protein
MTNRKRVDRPMKMLSVDLVGPLPKSRKGHIYVLSVSDVFSKYAWFIPLRKANSKEIIDSLERRIFLVEGVPQVIISDNGKQFVSREFKGAMEQYGVQSLFYTTLYTPQVNGVERYHSILSYTLGMYVESDQRNWDLYLDHVQSIINQTVNLSTGFSPALLAKGREIVMNGSLFGKVDQVEISRVDRLSDDRYLYNQKMMDLSTLFKIVTGNLWKAYVKYAKYYNLRRKNITYKEGDTVWRRNFVQSNAGEYFTTKLAPRFINCRVIKKISDLVYELQDIDSGSKNRFHIKDILKVDVKM